MATQLKQICTLVFCSNNINLKMAVISAETCCENTVNKIHHDIEVHFVAVCILQTF